MAYLPNVHIDHVAQLVEDRSSFLDPILHIIITNGANTGHRLARECAILHISRGQIATFKETFVN